MSRDKISDQKKLARREFLKNSATSSAAVAATGILSATPAGAAGVPGKWDRRADVVIVGSGISGMCAAVEAAEAGAKVIVLEKDTQAGGVSKLSGGDFMVAGTELQKRLKIEDHPDVLFDDMMENSEMTAVPELIRNFADNAPEHILWLEQRGVKFADYVSGLNHHAHWVGPSPDYPGGNPAANGGLGVMLMLFKAADKHGVTRLLQHRMTRIIRADASSPVLGVEVTNEGKTLNIKADRAVVIATGGFSANPQMFMAEDPRLTPDISGSGLPYVQLSGEGHLAALEAGAGLSTMANVSSLPIKWGTKVYQIWEPPTLTTVPSGEVGVPIADFQHVILVKSDGKRYVDETLGSARLNLSAYPKLSIGAAQLPSHPFNEAYLNLKERPRNVWAVTDSDGVKALKWQMDQVRKPDPKSGVALYPDMVAAADNLKDLAAKMGVDPAGLEATVMRYNSFVDGAKDADFGKPKPAYKIGAGPFYAVKLCMLHHTQRNGIRVNTKGQVLDRRDLLVSKGVHIDREKPVAHLYASGECANYLGRYHLSGTLAIYSYYGRVAGKNAAAEKPLT